MRKTVYALALNNGLELLWTIEMSMKAPVVEYSSGHARLINDRGDNDKFLDVLDAIMAKRREGTYPKGLTNKNSPHFAKKEMDMLEGEGRVLPMQWADIAFADDVNLDQCQNCIDSTRRLLVL